MSQRYLLATCCPSVVRNASVIQGWRLNVKAKVVYVNTTVGTDGFGWLRDHAVWTRTRWQFQERTHSNLLFGNVKQAGCEIMHIGTETTPDRRSLFLMK